MTKLLAADVKVRCRPILNRPDLVELVMNAGSRTEATHKVDAATGQLKKATAAGWLWVLHHQYPDDFNQLMVQHTPMPKGGVL